MQTKKLLLTFVTLFLQVQLFGQGNNYTTQQFGAHSNLLGGAVVAGVRDNSCIFYNPGAIALSDEGVSVSANAYRASFFDMWNGAGKDLNINTTNFSSIPQLISGNIKHKFLHQLQLAYGIMSAGDYKQKFNVTNDITVNLNNFPVDQNYITYYNYSNHFQEYLACLGIGYQINDYLAIGISHGGLYRDQKSISIKKHDLVPLVDNLDDLQVATVTSNWDISYISVDMFNKIGICLDLNRFKAGATLTFPTIHIFGDGKVYREFRINNLEHFDSTKISFVASNTQNALPAEYKRPWSVGLGLEYMFNKVRLCGSLTWYSGIDNYAVIKPEAQYYYKPATLFTVPTSDKELSVYTNAQELINVAFGVDYTLSKKFTLHGGFRTNVNYYDIDRLNDITDGFVLGSDDIGDLYHFTLGGTLKLKNSNITAGIDYGFSNSNNMQQLINFTNPTIDNYLYGLTDNSATLNLHMLSVVLGITHFTHK